MTIPEMKDLFAYDAWANALVFDAASALTDEQWHHPIASSFPSIAATMAHTVGAEWVWLRRWMGESPTSVPVWVAAPVLADIRAVLSDVERERAAFLDGLTDDDLGRTVTYSSLSGQPFAEPLGGLMRHVVNHSTYHRGQVATQLRQLGLKPPGTDLIVYLRRKT